MCSKSWCIHSGETMLHLWGKSYPEWTHCCKWSQETNNNIDGASLRLAALAHIPSLCSMHDTVSFSEPHVWIHVMLPFVNPANFSDTVFTAGHHWRNPMWLLWVSHFAANHPLSHCHETIVPDHAASYMVP